MVGKLCLSIDKRKDEQMIRGGVYLLVMVMKKWKPFCNGEQECLVNNCKSWIWQWRNNGLSMAEQWFDNGLAVAHAG